MGEKEDNSSVYSITEHSEILSRWVAHNILEGRDDNERVSIFLKFLKLAVKLQRCNNYNTSAAIVAGLSEVSITRLKNIVEDLNENQTKKLVDIKESYSPMGKYRGYRELPSTIGCIPFLAVFLRD